MKVSYDPHHNIAYIRLREKGAEVETFQVSDELDVDLAPDGTVYGIELLNANEQLRCGLAGGAEPLCLRESEATKADRMDRRSLHRTMGILIEKNPIIGYYADGAIVARGVSRGRSGAA